MRERRQETRPSERIRSFFRARGTSGVVSVYLFGSHARGAAHRESDVDVGVLLSRQAFPSAASRFDERVGMTAELIDALDCNEVDVVILNDAPPLFARHVVLEGERVYCSDPSGDRDFVRDTQLRAADLAPFLRRTRRIKLDAIRS